MNYTSTRKSSISITAADAIIKGISEEGGLFVPGSKQLPKITQEEIQGLAGKSYQERAFDILKLFLDFSDDDLLECVNNAYSWNFRTLGATRLVELDNSVSALELWHGPTAAFKDMALQILPGLLNLSMKKAGKSGKTLILTATSGDTGKAALEGFKDVDGVEIAVFYPEYGVSEIQKLQMTTQEGENVHVFAVKGNFDDCQNAVKAVFADSEVKAKANSAGVSFSSANSINWGRLCPQIVYYISAYAELVRQKTIKCGDKVNICVPTGNFGNILAAYYAMEMGIPVNKLICASNSNKVLTDFIKTGIYDINRDFRTTISPSMDILVSSNLERLLYHLSGNNDSVINEWFSSLKKTGKFEIDNKVKTKINSIFHGGWCSEEDTKKTIRKVFHDFGYLMDTHTAVGYKVWRDYKDGAGKSDSKIKTIIASTASPYKFADAVHETLFGKFEYDDYNYNNIDINNENPEEIKPGVMESLEEKTGIGVPKQLAGIREKEVRFTEKLEINGIKDAVLKILAQ